LAAAGAFDGSSTTDGCAGEATLVGEVATDDFAVMGAIESMNGLIIFGLTAASLFCHD
jgi:hypothetical protein